MRISAAKRFRTLCARRFSKKVEDAADLEAYTEALEADDDIRYSMDEVMRMAMMAE